MNSVRPGMGAQAISKPVVNPGVTAQQPVQKTLSQMPTSNPAKQQVPPVTPQRNFGQRPVDITSKVSSKDLQIPSFLSKK